MIETDVEAELPDVIKVLRPIVDAVANVVTECAAGRRDVEDVIPVLEPVAKLAKLWQTR